MPTALEATAKLDKMVSFPLIFSSVITIFVSSVPPAFTFLSPVCLYVFLYMRIGPMAYAALDVSQAEGTLSFSLVVHSSSSPLQES